MAGAGFSAYDWRCAAVFFDNGIQDRPASPSSIAAEGYYINTAFPHRYNFWTHQPLAPGSAGPPFVNVFPVREYFIVENLIEFLDNITPAVKTAFSLRVQVKTAFSGLSGTFDLPPKAPNVAESSLLTWIFPDDEANPLFEEVGTGVGAHSHSDETSRIYCWYPFFQTLPGPNNTFPANIDEKCGWPP